MLCEIPPNDTKKKKRWGGGGCQESLNKYK